jgi:hypothetical protein
MTRPILHPSPELKFGRKLGLTPHLISAKAADGKAIANPQTGVKSEAYDRFVAPLTNGIRGGFDVHVYWYQVRVFQSSCLKLDVFLVLCFEDCFMCVFCDNSGVG